MPTAMVISPHADDAAAFCGATLAKFADQGWQVILVRVTDDRKDSVGLSIEETIRRNTEELHAAARILGVAQIIELGFETDVLADVPLGRLRERFVYLFRKHRPYAVFTFDPFGLFENNQDHIRVAQAVDEAFWVSCFDKHYPEHFQEPGVEPFSVCERWYFARQLPKVTHYEEIAATIERKIRAVCAHREMMRNTIQQYRLQLRTWGKRVPWLDQSMEGDLQPLIGTFLQEQAKAAAIEAGWDPESKLAEAFRLERFGDLEPLFQLMAETVEPGVAIPRPGLDAESAASESAAPMMGQIIPADIDQKIRLMGHHHLCAGAFEGLLAQPAFQLGYAQLIEHLRLNPDLLIESIFGYDLFCYLCGYWDEEQGRCSTGWKNKITKDAAVLQHLGLRPGDLTRLEDLQRRLAERVSPADLQRFCGPGGEWKCEFYALGVCQRAFEDLRRKFGVEAGF